MTQEPSGEAAVDPLDELIAEAMRGERLLAVGGSALHGWWTGTLASGEQLLAAPWGEELFLLRFDRGGDLLEIQRRPFVQEPPEGSVDLFHVADIERTIRETFADFASGVVRVKPFWVEEIELELHPLPDSARRFIDAGWPARRICRSESERRELRQWLERGWCQVDFHSDGCWFDEAGNVAP